MKWLKYTIIELDLLAWTLFLIYVGIYYKYYFGAWYNASKTVLESVSFGVLFDVLGLLVTLTGLVALINLKLAEDKVRSEIKANARRNPY